jgi:hypothetical protein
MGKITSSNGAPLGSPTNWQRRSVRSIAAHFSSWPPVTIVAWLIGALAVSGCGTNPYHPDVNVIDSVSSRALVQNEGLVSVRVSVPTPEETKQIFDVALYDSGVQPV